MKTDFGCLLEQYNSAGGNKALELYYITPSFDYTILWSLFTAYLLAGFFPPSGVSSQATVLYSWAWFIC